MPTPHRILIADDDAEIRSGAGELLDALGCEVLEACGGREALEIVRRGTIHLALLDVHMPGLDDAPAGVRVEGGLELFTRFREERPGLPCIFWSGEASEGIRTWALREGASAFLRKPVQPALLRGEVQRVLDEHWGGAA